MALSPYPKPDEFLRPRRVTTQADDPLGQMMADDRDARLAFDLANAPAPDVVAKVDKLAAKHKAPAALVQADLPTFERMEQSSKLIETARKHPTVGDWARQGRNAAVAVDDADNIGALARTWYEAKASGIRMLGTLAQGAWGFLEATADAATEVSPLSIITLGMDEKRRQAIIARSPERLLANMFRSARRFNQGVVETHPTRVQNWLGRNLIQGLDSLATSAVALATRNPSMAVGTMSAVTGGSEYGKAIDAGKAPYQALRYAGQQGFIEGMTEKLPASQLLADVAAKSPFAKTLVKQLVAEIPGEQVATFLQDMNEWTTLNPDKSVADFLKERPMAAAETLVQTVSGTGAQTAAVVGAQRAVDYLDRVAKKAEKVKIKQRDPEAFKALMNALGQDNGVENVYIPAEAVRQYMQDNDLGWDDLGWGDEVSGQYDEAVAMGGDLVVPVGTAMANIAGTPAFDVLKNDMRLTPGGQSLSEAEEFANAMADELHQAGVLADEVAYAEAQFREPRQKVFDGLVEKLTAAGYRQDVASQYALLATERAATRAERTGKPLTGDEYANLEINQVMPAGLAAMMPRGPNEAASLARVIVAMRGRAPSDKQGPSLAAWIRAQGGVDDDGGELASMGAGPIKGISKKGQIKLIRRSSSQIRMDKAQGGLAVGSPSVSANGLDALFEGAIQAGYFPHLQKTSEIIGGVDSGTFAGKPDIREFLDAIDRELRGNPIYPDAGNDNPSEDMRVAAQELRQLLEQEGLDPATVTEAEVSQVIERYMHPTQIKSVNNRGTFDASDPRILFQSSSDGPRGRVTFQGQRTVIDLFQERDLSTFIHEMGHYWLEEMFTDAADPNATDELKSDVETIKAWFKANGHDVTNGIPTDAHELWARGIERYTMEGKAPSSALRKAFASFRSWLLRLYGLVDSLKAPITPEIRSVMDRMFATDQEIEAALAEQNIAAAFTDAAQAGMTEAEFDVYSKAVTAARDEAHDALLFKVMEDVRRRRTKEYKEARAGIEDRVRGEVDARPVFRAYAMLQGNGQKLNRAWLLRNYGDGILDQLPKGVPPLHADQGGNPDVIAEMAGFGSGDEMIKALIGLADRRASMQVSGDKRSVRQATIDEETDALMVERYGDPLNDGSIEEEALAAVHNERQGEVLAMELRQLGKKSGGLPATYKIAKEWAADKIAAGTVNDVASRAALNRYARTAAKAARDAEKAILAGDMQAAFRHKQAQMLNNALIAEASKAADAIEKALKRMGNLARKRTIKSMDQDHLDQIHALLEQVDLRMRSQKSIDRQDSFQAWAEAQQAAGRDIVVPSSFAITLGQRNWSRLTVEELLGLDETVKQIAHLGRHKQTLIDNKEKREYEAVRAEALDAIGKLPPKPPKGLADPDFVDRLKAGVASIDAALLKAETIFDWLDGGTGGVFNRIVFQPIADAQTRSGDMQAKAFADVRAAMEKIDADTLRKWSSKVTIPELIDRETGQPVHFQRHKLVAMALNMGNEGNIQRLTDGHGWNEQAVRDVLNRELSEQEWAFVQEVWDIIDGFWPELAAMERRVNGVEPDKVEAVPVETPFGILKGGYYPAVYDWSKEADADRVKGGDSDSILEPGYTRATTRASSTKARADQVSRPIMLNLGVINRHLGEVIHDITHREAVLQADRFITDPRIVAAIDGTLGPEIRKQLRPWLKHVANQWALDREAQQGAAAFMGRLRSNTTAVGMGFRISTMLMQVAGYSNSFEYVGARWVTEAIAQVARRPIDSFNFVMERSGEVRQRMDTLDRDIADGIRRAAGGGVALSDVKRFMFHGIGYMDRVVVIPTWLGAYNKALAAGADEAGAIVEADKAVRKSQGAGAAKDLATVQRGRGTMGELSKYLTMFYSYMSAFYQRQRTLGRDVRTAKPRDFPKLLARAWWLMIVPPLLSELLAGRGPDDEEDWTMWSFKQMLFNVLGPIPLVRDFAKPAWAAFNDEPSFGYSFTPVAKAFDTGVNLFRDLGNIVEGEETKRATRNALETVGYATGLVPGQIAASVQFLIDVGYGEQDPQSMGDWWEGLTKGKIAEE